MKSQIEQVSRLCPDCGRENDDDARFCKYCSFDLNGLRPLPSEPPVEETLPSAQNKVPMILGILAMVVIGLIALAVYLRSNSTSQGSGSSPQSTSNLSLTSSATQNKTNPATPTPRATVAPPAASTADSAPSEDMVEAAIKKAFGKLKDEGRTDATPGIRVVGVQSLAGMGGARADVDLTNATFLQDDLLNGQWEIGPGGVGGRMIYPKKRIRIENCTAVLKHYTNGRWVLESIDTQSHEFGVIKVNIDL